MKYCCTSLASSVTTLILGFLLVLGASLFIGLKAADQIINNELHKNLHLSLDSFVFSEWQDPTPPIYMQYWFYNVSNSENVSHGQKPTVKEFGPFTFRLYQPKSDIAFYANNTVSYKYNHTLVFQPGSSYGNLNMSITQLNIPLLTFQSLVKNLSIPSYLLNIAIAALKDSDLFVTHTVEEWLFGYQDNIFKVAHDILKLLNINISPNFGLFYAYNNSNDGIYLVKSGKEDFLETNVICKWNGNDLVNWWTTKEANMINGTDGNFMSPKVSTSKKLYVFVTDVCRSLYFIFSKKTSVKGINTYKFSMPAEVFANASENIDNAGFCVPYGQCLDSGVLDISTCKQGAPVVVSSPHFYLAAKQYIDGVNGMHPKKEEHETFVNVEPLSGFVFSGAKRLQINVHLKNYGIFSSLQEVKEVIMPVLWLNESVYLDQSTADMFNSKVVILIHLVNAFQYVILAIGVILLLVGIGLTSFSIKNKKTLSAEVLLRNDDDDSD